MAQVTFSQPPKSGRSKAFWLGLGLGLLGMFLTVAILWFFGVLDFSKEDTEVANNEANNATLEVPVDNDVEETVVNETPAEDEEETLNDVAKEAEETSTSQKSTSPFIADIVTAKDISDDYDPVDETSTFSESDEKVYVIVTLTGDAPEGTEVGVEWLLEGSKVSDFSTETESGQQLVYFFQTIQAAGDYTANILIDGEKADSVKFVVE